ncbi:MAG: hypothetical protein ACI87M_000601, partial [Yoonia sp.]
MLGVETILQEEEYGERQATKVISSISPFLLLQTQL